VTGDKPYRVQLKRTKGWRMPPNTVKVDRSTKYGNPVACGRPHHCARAECGCCPQDGFCCIDVFREYVQSGIDGRHSCSGSLSIGLDAIKGYPKRNRLIAGLTDLRGKNLACWCPLDQPCHADVLLELSNEARQ
jgi:hypothetical protein